MQRDLAVSHDRFGAAVVAAGDLTAARTAYQASLDTAARPASAGPATRNGSATWLSVVNAWSG